MLAIWDPWREVLDVHASIQMPRFPDQVALALKTLHFAGELTGIKIPDSISEEYKAHYADLDIYGTVNFTNNVGLQVGYRTIDVGYLVEKDSGSFVLKGLYSAVVLRY